MNLGRILWGKSRRARGVEQNNLANVLSKRCLKQATNL